MRIGASLKLLSDQPVGEDGQQDLLGRSAAAHQLAELIRSSREMAPFTLAIYADWGMGKSSLLRQVAREFADSRDIETVWFNAWTANRSDALETLIKSVLDRLDPSALRRLARRVGGDSGVTAWARVALHGVAGAIRMHHLVDEIWKQLSIDSRARNEARELLRSTLSKWAEGDGRASRRRTIVVFVDDLDRCAPDVIRAVCDAVKQYLNIQGIVFVVGCDRNVIETAVADNAQPISETIGQRYLEKIVQASYSIPVPTDHDAHILVEGYARQAGTLELFQGAVVDVIIEHAGRNPRRIKRLINRFIVEYRLDPTWVSSSPGALVRVILLQDFYPGFFDLLVFKDVDPIDEFTDYLAIREMELPIPANDHASHQLVERFLREHRLPRALSDGAKEDLLERIEAELPPEYGRLAVDRTFIGLVSELARSSTDQALRARLRGQETSRPLSSADRLAEYDFLPTRILMELIGRAERLIRILDTSSTLMAEGGTQFTRTVEQAMARGVRVQVLLLAPTTQTAQDRAAEIQDPAFDTRIEDSISELRRLKHKMVLDGVEPGRLEVRLYDRLPECSVHQVDDRLMVAFLPYQRRTSRVKHLEVARDTSLGQFAELQFEAKWSSARPLEGMRYAEVRTGAETKHLLLRIWEAGGATYLASNRIEDILADNGPARGTGVPGPQVSLAVEDRPGEEFGLSDPLFADSPEGILAAEAFAAVFGATSDAPIRRLKVVP